MDNEVKNKNKKNKIMTIRRLKICTSCIFIVLNFYLINGYYFHESFPFSFVQNPSNYENGPDTPNFSWFFYKKCILPLHQAD